MGLEEYDVVRLLRAYPDYNAPAGAQGTVLVLLTAARAHPERAPWNFRSPLVQPNRYYPLPQPTWKLYGGRGQAGFPVSGQPPRSGTRHLSSPDRHDLLTPAGATVVGGGLQARGEPELLEQRRIQERHHMRHPTGFHVEHMQLKGQVLT